MQTLRSFRSMPAPLFSLAAVAAFCMAFAFPTKGAGGVTWQGDFDAAFETAKADSKVVFLAVNMDDEKGNDRMVENVYTDRTFLKLAGQTVNMVASVGRHKSSGKCPHLGTDTCAEHRAVEAEANGKILKPDAAGHVVAPQHVWLNGEGKVLLSVPYEITAGEMEWCFHEAGRRMDPNYAGKESSKSKRPRRWIPDGVYDGSNDPSEQPPTREEALELIKEIRKGALKGADLVKAYRRLAQADEEEAREQVLQYLKSGTGGGGRRGGGGRNGNATKTTLIRAVGLASPPSYWEVLDTLVGSGEEALRSEVAVAMEQLAAPEALKSLTKAYKKEKTDAVRKNLLRAIAACGGKDKGAKSLLIKAAKQRRDDNLRHNALIGLGWQIAQGDVQSTVEKVLNNGSPEDRLAAVVGMGISRDPIWAEKLKELSEEEGESALIDAAKAALEVHAKGDYRALSATLQEVSGDTIARNRLFRPLKEKGKEKDE